MGSGYIPQQLTTNKKNMAKAVDHFDDKNEVTSNWVKFNVPIEDKIFGTLVAKRQIKSTLPGKENEMVWVYDLKADYGSFHELDDEKEVIETPVTVLKNDYYSIGGKPGIDRQMTNVKLGQKIGFKFIDETPSKTKGFAPSKNIKVFAPKNDAGAYLMDEEWLNENRVASFDAE